jgi:ketosteroid isomerase-like protein
MALERNKELAREAIAIWSTGDLSRVLEVFAPGYVMHPTRSALHGDRRCAVG